MTTPIIYGRGKLLAAGVAMACALIAASDARSQEEAGLAVRKACSDPLVTPGGFVNCNVVAEHDDPDNPLIRIPANTFEGPGGLNVPPLQDEIEVLGITVPTAGFVFGGLASLGSLPAITGNAACQDADGPPGDACDELDSGADCVLPCVVCRDDAGGTIDDFPDARNTVQTGLTCPDTGVVGQIRVRHENVAGPVAQCPSPPFVQDFATAQGLAWGDDGEEDTIPEFRRGAQADTIGCTVIGCPEITIEKTCDRVSDETGACLGDITITVTNNADAESLPAANCRVVDTLDPDGAATNVALSGAVNPLSFSLAPGETQVFTGQTGPLSATTTNEARVVCDPCQDAPIEAFARDDCQCTTLNDYKCYQIKPSPRTRFERRDLEIVDQFGTRTSVIARPTQVCNPVDKEGEGIGDPDAHLTCYKVVTRGREPRRLVADVDQFTPRDAEDALVPEELMIGRGAEVCFPALKNCVEDEENTCVLDEIERRLSHFQCYQARSLAEEPFVPGILDLVDQFGATESDVGPAIRHCNPLRAKAVDGSGEELSVATFPPSSSGDFWTEGDEVHLKCYGLSDTTRPGLSSVTIQDQLHPEGLSVRVGRATQLCEPAVKLTPLEPRPLRRR